MNQYLFFICAGALLAAALGCESCGKEEKPTIVEGRVVDAKTGVGVPNANITFSVRPKGSDENAGNLMGTTTEATGNFRIEILPGFIGGNLVIQKIGYFSKIFLENPIKTGSSTQLLVEISPSDSALKLSLKNVSGIYDSIYIRLYNSDIEFPGISQPQSPTVLLTGEERSEYFLNTSDSWTKIIWANTLVDFLGAPMIDSVYHMVADTSDVSIYY